MPPSSPTGLLKERGPGESLRPCVLINLSKDAEAGDTEAPRAPVGFMSALFGEALARPRALRRVLFFFCEM